MGWNIREIEIGTGLQMTGPAEMLVLFGSDQNQSRDGQDQLQPLHAYLMRAQWHLAPLRGRTTAEAAKLHQNRQVQQRAEKGDPDHRYPNPVRVESLERRCNSGTHRQRPDADHKSEAVESGKKCADALQKCKEQTRPRNYAPSALGLDGHRLQALACTGQWFCLNRRHRKEYSH